MVRSRLPGLWEAGGLAAPLPFKPVSGDRSAPGRWRCRLSGELPGLTMGLGVEEL